MYQYLNNPSNKLFMHYLIIVFLIIIVSLIYYNIQNGNNVHSKISKKIQNSTNEITKSTQKLNKSNDKSMCPQCDCPSVDDIVGGIFPGRNTGLLTGENPFDISASDNLFQTTPEYQYYESQKAFQDSSLFDLNDTPLTKNNPYSRSNNSIANQAIDTQTTDNSADSRMNKGIRFNNDMKYKNNPSRSTRDKNINNEKF